MMFKASHNSPTVIPSKKTPPAQITIETASYHKFLARKYSEESIRLINEHAASFTSHLTSGATPPEKNLASQSQQTETKSPALNTSQMSRSLPINITTQPRFFPKAHELAKAVSSQMPNIHILETDNDDTSDSDAAAALTQDKHSSEEEGIFQFEM